jgi:hypothetical protein
LYESAIEEYTKFLESPHVVKHGSRCFPVEEAKQRISYCKENGNKPIKLLDSKDFSPVQEQEKLLGHDTLAVELKSLDTLQE